MNTGGGDEWEFVKILLIFLREIFAGTGKCVTFAAQKQNGGCSSVG